MVQILDGTRNWLRITLALSLVLNMFFLAFLGGQMLRPVPDIPRSADPLARLLAVAQATLPPSDAKLFREALLKEEPRYAQAVKRFTQAREEALNQISANPYDPVSTLMALSAMQSAWAEFMDTISGPVVDAIGEVSTEGRRRAVADQKARGIQRMP
ncbi:MAG: periplasmic heavy metal sensor [Allorhizobium sp.]